MLHEDAVLFDDLCRLVIPTVGPLVSDHLISELEPGDIVPRQEEIDEAARDCGKMLASGWLEFMRYTVKHHTAPGPVFLASDLVPVTETDPEIYKAMIGNVSSWQLMDTNVHHALALIGVAMFAEEKTNFFFLPFRLVLYQTASGYALSQRLI